MQTMTSQLASASPTPGRTLAWPGQSPADVVTRAVREFRHTHEWQREVLVALDDAVRVLSATELSGALARAQRG